MECQCYLVNISDTPNNLYCYIPLERRSYSSCYSWEAQDYYYNYSEYFWKDCLQHHNRYSHLHCVKWSFLNKCEAKKRPKHQCFIQSIWTSNTTCSSFIYLLRTTIIILSLSLDVCLLSSKRSSLTYVHQFKPCVLKTLTAGAPPWIALISKGDVPPNHVN